MVHRSASLRCLKQVLQIGTSISKVGNYRLASHVSSSLQQPFEAITESKPDNEGYAEIDWDNLGFGIVTTDYMYSMTCSKDKSFTEGELNSYGKIDLSPSAGVLNYGQGLYEGTKVQRGENGGLFLFRPDENAKRMQIGAERLCMPCPSVEQFVHAVKQTALANKRWIPPQGKGSLYIRPILFGSGPVLGLAPSPEYTFLIYASPVGNYFKEGFAPLNIYVEDEFHRATRGGAGGVKSITNYAPVLKAIARAKNKGFSDVLYLDSVNKRYLEEVSSCNIFIVQGNSISTPATNGTILEGITRKSVMDIASDLGFKVEERCIPVEELMNADEVFCTGTAVVVASVGSVTYKGKRVDYKKNYRSSVSHQLYTTLIGIQKGVIQDERGWLIKID